MIGFLDCKRTLPAFHSQASPNSSLEDCSLFTSCQACIHPWGCPGSTSVKPVKILLDVILSLLWINHTTQLRVNHKLAEGTVSPAVHVTDKDHTSPSRDCWGTPPVTGLHLDIQPTSLWVWLADFLLSESSIKSMPLHFRNYDVTQNSIKYYILKRHLILFLHILFLLLVLWLHSSSFSCINPDNTERLPFKETMKLWTKQRNRHQL